MKNDFDSTYTSNVIGRASSDEVCTTREASKLLGVSLRTVQLWVESGSLLAWKTDGGHRRISIASVTNKLNHRSQKISTSREIKSILSVLVVEDDRNLTRLYEATIAKWGVPISMRCASDGFEALMMIGKEKPDIIITDINMPGMDGLAMLKKLRMDSAYDDIEIIVVTGIDTQSIEAMGGVPDRVSVFLKPVPFALLQSRFQEMANSRLSRTQGGHI